MNVTIDSVYLHTAVLGAISGMRSMSGIALATRRIARDNPTWLRNTPLAPITAQNIATLTAILATGEIVLDKLSILPARIAPLPLAGRVVFGAVAGATWAGYNKRKAAIGGLIGALGALAGSYAGYWARKSLMKRLELPIQL